VRALKVAKKDKDALLIEVAEEQIAKIRKQINDAEVDVENARAVRKAMATAEGTLAWLGDVGAYRGYAGESYSFVSCIY
jgi:hypothetical protein